MPKVYQNNLLMANLILKSSAFLSTISELVKIQEFNYHKSKTILSQTDNMVEHKKI